MQRLLALRAPAPALAARFSSKRRVRYGSEAEARQSTRLLSFAKKKQQAQLSRLKLALAQDEVAQLPAVATADTPAVADGEMSRVQRAKLDKAERIKHLPLFRGGSPLLRSFGERTLGHYELLPGLRFEGDVVVVHSDAEELPHADYLRAQRVIGVDTESKPDFRKHKRGNPVCLIQVATLERAFIYRLQRGRPLPPVLRELFEDERVLKVGHSLNDDFRLLKASELVSAVNSTIDTLPIANKLGCLRPGLRTLGQVFLGGTISKEMQVSNWEAPTLSAAQISYAATDAWAPLRVLLAMVQLDDTRTLLRLKSYSSATQPTINDDHDKVLAMLYGLARGHGRGADITSS